MLFPRPGEAVAHYTVNGWKVATTANMAVIFLIFGVTLETRELADAARARCALALGAGSILFLTPLTGILAARLPFKPREFALGLAVMACAPTSLSSGVTLVGQGGGSGALALLLTVSTNVVGIATAPLMVKLALGGLPNAGSAAAAAAEASLSAAAALSAGAALSASPVSLSAYAPPPPPSFLLGAAPSFYNLSAGVAPLPGGLSSALPATPGGANGGGGASGHANGLNGGHGGGGKSGGAHVDTLDLLVKLGTSILAPLIFGKVVREAGPRSFRDVTVPKSKSILYLANNLQISMIVWQKISAARSVLLAQGFLPVFFASLATVGWHFLLLAINGLACGVARLPERERKAVVLMASQKNLPTAAVIISYFDAASVGDLGLMTVPCIVWYVAQLFVDAYLASAWASKWERLQGLEEAYKEELAAVRGEERAAGGAGGKEDGTGGLAALAAGEAATTGGGGGGGISKGASAFPRVVVATASARLLDGCAFGDSSVAAGAGLLRRRSSSSNAAAGDGAGGGPGCLLPLLPPLSAPGRGAAARPPAAPALRQQQQQQQQPQRPPLLPPPDDDDDDDDDGSVL